MFVVVYDALVVANSLDFRNEFLFDMDMANVNELCIFIRKYHAIR